MSLDYSTSQRYHLPCDIVWIRQFFEHHSTKSGYDRLCSSLKKKITSNTKSFWYTQSTGRRRQTGSQQTISNSRSKKNFWTHRGTFTELKAMLYKACQRKIIHVTYGEIIMGLLRFKSLKCKIKLILTVHQTKAWWMQYNIPASYFDQIDGIIVLGQKEIDFFNQLTNGKAHYIPHGVDTNFFTTISRDEMVKKTCRNEFSCLTVGQWQRDYQILEHVINIITEKEPYIFFDVVISDEMINSHLYKNSLRRIIKHKNVRWHNKVKDEELHDLYCNANVLLLPLENAVANNTILEASASGLPIVATNIGGVSDYTTSDFAILTQPGQITEMAEAVISIKNSPENYVFKSEKARAYANENFSWEIVGHKVVELYNRLCSQQNVV